MRRLIVLMFLLTTFAGCTHITDRYAMSGDNVAAIRSLGGQGFNVGAFSSGSGVAGKSISCAGVAISPPDDATFTEYVRGALIAELKMANAYSSTSPTTISGNIETLEVDAPAFLLTGKWLLVLKVTVNEELFVVSERYSFRSQSLNMTSCEGASRRFSSAVQNLVNQVVTAPELKNR